MKTRRFPIAFAAAALVLAGAWLPAGAATCMNPAQVPSLQVSRDELCWSPVTGTSRYTAVAGLSLARLRAASPGLAQVDYACLVTAEPVTCTPVPFDPPAGDGFFFLVRTVRGGFNGSYSTRCPTESGDRDGAMDAAVLCP
jgi:hypothetical protein